MNQMLKYPFNDIEKISVIINNNSHDWLWSRAAKIYSMRVRKYAYLTSGTLRTRSVQCTSTSTRLDEMKVADGT